MPYTSFQAGLAGHLLRNFFRSLRSLQKICPYSVVFPLVTLTEYEMDRGAVKSLDFFIL